MGQLKIKTINRNLGALSQSYRIEYRKQGDAVWITGPTLTYAQALTSMPLYINIPDTWMGSNAEIHIVTICGDTTIVGTSVFVLIEEQDCTGGITPPQNTNILYYGSTVLDTTGALQPEASYVSSVTDTFTNNTQSDKVFIPGGNIQVDDFGVLSDKVLFIQVPPAEAAFTKWSEVGNPFQQNLPVDQSYGVGSSVWFKSTRAGQTVYITRYQTQFSGSVLLSR